jgi:hypothetical protein
MKAVLLTVSLYDIDEHAQKFMKRIGAEYGLAVPQSIADCWQFYMCEYDPDKLPDFVCVKNEMNPNSLVGYGLSREDAAHIIKWMTENGFYIPS